MSSPPGGLPDGSDSTGRVEPHPAFFGWRVAGAAFVTQAVAIGFTIGTVAVFAAPIAVELGFSATQFNLGVSLFTLVMNLSMPFIGRALDRGSIARVMIIGAVVLSASLVGIALAQNLVHLAIAFGGGCAVGMAMLGPMPSSAAVANWFEVKRGRALGLANMGAPAGPMLLAPLAALSISQIGWRSTLFGYAVLTLFVALPMIWFGVLDRPSDHGQFPDGQEPAHSGEDSGEFEPAWTAGELFRTRDFWLLALGVAPIVAAGIVLGANSVPFMIHHGATTEAASFVVVFQSAGAIAGPVIFGSLADRVHPRLLFIGLIAAFCLALSGLHGGPGYTVSLVLFTIAGLVGGSMMPVYGALIARLFGASAFGQVMGAGALVGMPFVFVAPVAFGQAFDSTGEYGLGLRGLTTILALGGLCFLALSSGKARRSLPSVAGGTRGEGSAESESR